MKPHNFHDCGGLQRLRHLVFFTNHLKLVNSIPVGIYFQNIYMLRTIFKNWKNLKDISHCKFLNFIYTVGTLINRFLVFALTYSRLNISINVMLTKSSSFSFHAAEQHKLFHPLQVNVPFLYRHENIRKSTDVPMFSGCKERKHWPGAGENPNTCNDRKSTSREYEGVMLEMH